MSINGINHKVSTVGKGQSADASDASDASSANQNEQVEDYFNGAFGNESGTNNTDNKAASGSGNPLDSYTAGDINNGQVNGDPYTNSADGLINFPPSLEEVVAGNPSSMEYLDLLAIKYEKAEEGLRELIENYRMTLPNVSASEAADLQLRMDAATQAIVRCGSERGKIATLAEQQGNTYLKEIDEMKDLNNDNWIGRPNHKGSYYIKYNDDGTITYLDPVTKRAVINPVMDRAYSAQFTNNDNLNMISADESGYDGGEIVDLYLQLTESALNNADGSGKFGCPVDIGIPEYVWVERDPDAEGDYKWQYEDEGASAESKITLYNEWESGSDGIKQKIPENLSNYIQVQITGVTVSSVDSGYTATDGTKLYNHLIEFKSNTDILTRIVVEGFKADQGLPSAASTKSGDNYVAPSTVGISLHGQDRVNPLEINASSLNSTGRHLVPDLVTELELGDAASDGEMAYNENVGNFTDKEHTTQYYEVNDGSGDWKDKNHGWNSGDYAYGDYNDRYLSKSENPGDNDTLMKFHSGIFISGVRGDITGTNNNDVIETLGVGEYSSKYAEDHLPDNLSEIMKTDPFYYNRVNSDGGNDIVVCGAGDNYVIGATFVKIRGANRQDDNIIITPEIRNDKLTDDGGKRNPKCYIDVDGGNKTMIYNPIEFDFSKGDGDTDDIEAWKGAHNDDYYNVDRGTVIFQKNNDEDISKSTGISAEPGSDRSLMVEEANTSMAEWYDELTKIPELNEDEVGSSWDEVMGAKNDLDNEMNGFFEEMFGGFENLF